MLRSRVFLGLLACACANSRVEQVVPPADRVAAISDADLVPEALPEPEPEPEAATCPVEIPPPLPAAGASEPTTSRCRKPARALARQLETRARDRWYARHDDAQLSVEFDCDRAAPKIRELIVETSSGHGHSLHLDRIRPRRDGDYDLLRLELASDGNTVGSDPWAAMDGAGAIVKTGVLPGDRFERALRSMRAAVLMRLHERLPENVRGGSLRTNKSFHVAIRLVDAEGSVVQRFWAGTKGTREQDRWLPLDIAADMYVEVAWAADVEKTLESRSPVDDDRDFFVDRFVAARDRDTDYGYWYLREHLIDMARDLGDLRIAPDLLDIARVYGEHGVARSQAAAVDVLARITGYDPRYDRGEPRPPAEAAGDMLRICG